MNRRTVMGFARLALGAFGVAIAVGGAWLLVTSLGRDALLSVGAWLVGPPVVMDALVVPFVGLTGYVVSRLVRPRWRVAVGGCSALSGLVLLIGLPFISRAGARPDNPSLLDRPYAAGGAVLLAVIWIVGLLIGVRRERPVRGTGAD